MGMPWQSSHPRHCTPPIRYKTMADGPVYAKSNFPRHTYLLLCEEDVSVAQLEKIQWCYHLNSDFSPVCTPSPSITFPHLLPTQGGLPGGNYTEDSKVFPQQFQTMRPVSPPPDGKSSCMCGKGWVCRGGGRWTVIKDHTMARELSCIHYTGS